MGFETYLELIKFAFNNPKLVDENTIDLLISNLNVFLCQDYLSEDSNLEELYWEKLLKIIED